MAIPLSFSSRQEEILERATVGTGQWFLDSPEYLKWAEGEGGVLWCPGMPGAGKTVLSSIVIQHLHTVNPHNEKESPPLVLSIFLNYQDQTAQTPTNLIGSLLRQLLNAAPTIPPILQSLYDSSSSTSSPTIKIPVPALTKLLKLALEDYSKVYIVIDALDECPDDSLSRATLLSCIHSLISGRVRILITSRPLLSIENSLQFTDKLEIHAKGQDVDAYIESRIQGGGRLKRCCITDGALEGFIKEKVGESVDGMFLLARLHMDAIINSFSPSRVRKALGTLPSSVDASYDSALLRIESQGEEDRDLARQVFSWLTCALRPLSLGELQHALAVQEGVGMDVDDILDEEVLMGVCAGLVVVDNEKRSVRLVHHTAQQYFDTKHSAILHDPQTYITSTCLTYLLYDGIEDDLEQYPFLNYAKDCWYIHARGDAEVACHDQIIRYLEKIRKESETVEDVAAELGLDRTVQHLLDETSDDPRLSPRSILPFQTAIARGHEKLVSRYLKNGITQEQGRSSLFLAVSNGQQRIVELLLSNDESLLNDTDETLNGRTALTWAVVKNNEDLVRLLLMRNSIDVNIKDAQGSSALLLAAKQGFVGIARQLLARPELQVNQLDPSSTPLYSAAQNGYLEIVDMLLQREDIDVNLAHRMDGSTPLIAASDRHRTAVVERLLRHPDIDINLVDPQFKSATNMTAIGWAAKKGYVDVVSLLLAHPKIQINYTALEDESTPLHVAAVAGFTEVMKLLLAQRDVHTGPRKDGRSPFYSACVAGQLDAAQLLYQRGDVDVNQVVPLGSWRPLSGAASMGQESVVAFLLSLENIDVYAKTGGDHTALGHAAQKGHRGVVELFLAHLGPDINAPKYGQMSVLALAASKGYLLLVKMLLSYPDIDVKACTGPPQDEGLCSPLQWAAMEGQEEVFDLLLKHPGVDVNQQNSVGSTAFLLAAWHGNDSIVKKLQARPDVDVTLPYKDRASALSLATEWGYVDVMRILFEDARTDVNLPDKDGDTPLIAAVRYGQLEALKLLLEHPKIEVNKCNKYDESALSLAIEEGDKELINAMLAHKDTVVRASESEDEDNEDGSQSPPAAKGPGSKPTRRRTALT